MLDTGLEMLTLHHWPSNECGPSQRLILIFKFCTNDLPSSSFSSDSRLKETKYIIRNREREVGCVREVKERGTERWREREMESVREVRERRRYGEWGRLNREGERWRERERWKVWGRLERKRERCRVREVKEGRKRWRVWGRGRWRERGREIWKEGGSSN